MMVYRPWLQLKEVTPIKANLDPLNATQVYVIVVSVLTVALWCANTQLQEFTGAMGIVATLPLIAFFGAKVLSKDDFNGFLWNVVMLAMGGSALGEAIKSSGLLFSIASSIQDLTEGFDLYQVLVVFCLLVLICTTFISHTVGAMVILPIVQSVGEQMPGSPHPKLLVFAAALMCSGAMGLPISGFPNMNAVSLEDATGQTYVGVVDFLKVGLLSSFLAYLVIISVGYYLMLLVRF
jgi:phosphate transporter